MRIRLRYVVLIVALVVLGVVGGQKWYKAGVAERAYRGETAKYRMITAHQEARLAAMKAEAALKAELETSMPVLRLQAEPIASGPVPSAVEGVEGPVPSQVEGPDEGAAE